MACSNCSKRKKVVTVTKAIPAIVGYKEGDDGFVTVVFTGAYVTKARGKCTNKIYLFGVGATRQVDACDAIEFDKMRDFYIELVEVDDGGIQASASEEDSKEE